jgi:hypothetical protein
MSAAAQELAGLQQRGHGGIRWREVARRGPACLIARACQLAGRASTGRNSAIEACRRRHTEPHWKPALNAFAITFEGRLFQTDQCQPQGRLQPLAGHC